MTERIKTALITGSSRGIGLAAAKLFFESGYSVCLNCINNFEKMNEEAERLNQTAGPNRVAGLRADVSDYGECCRLVSFAEARFGGVDILINNAAISRTGLFTDMRPGCFAEIINSNLISAMNMSHLVLPGMVKNRSGVILNISSVWGSRGASCEAVYSASKGGLDAFTKSLAKEYGPSGIRVNSLSCGVIDTDMNIWLSDEEKDALADKIALSRFGDAAEIAKAALFLCSNDASYINGAVLRADGGM